MIALVAGPAARIVSSSPSGARKRLIEIAAGGNAGSETIPNWPGLPPAWTASSPARRIVVVSDVSACTRVTRAVA